MSSSALLTFFQVFSRLFVLWGLVEAVPSVSQYTYSRIVTKVFLLPLSLSLVGCFNRFVSSTAGMVSYRDHSLCLLCLHTDRQYTSYANLPEVSTILKLYIILTLLL